MTLSFGTCGASLMQPIMAVSERLEARWVGHGWHGPRAPPTHWHTVINVALVRVVRCRQLREVGVRRHRLAAVGSISTVSKLVDPVAQAAPAAQRPLSR